MKTLTFLLLLVVLVSSNPSVYTIYKLTFTPTIDGNIGEWGSEYIIDSIGAGGNDGIYRYYFLPVKPKDMKAYLYAGWIDSVIYIAVNVLKIDNATPEYFFLEVQPRRSSIVFNLDSNKFYSDTFRSYATNITLSPKVIVECCLNRSWIKQIYPFADSLILMGMVLADHDDVDNRYTETMFGGGIDTNCVYSSSIPFDKAHPSWQKSDLEPPISSEKNQLRNTLVPNLSILPNPCSGKFTVIANELSQKNRRLSLYDMSGKIVRSFFLTSDRTVFNVNDLPIGVYYLKSDNNIQKQCQKLIILH